MSHAAATALCRSQKLQCELYPSRDVALCLDPYCGLGFVLWCLSRWVSHDLYLKMLQWFTCCIALIHIESNFLLYFSIYSGHHSILIPPSEVEANPAVWLTAVHNYKSKYLLPAVFLLLLLFFFCFVFFPIPMLSLKSDQRNTISIIEKAINTHVWMLHCHHLR